MRRGENETAIFKANGADRICKSGRILGIGYDFDMVFITGAMFMKFSETEAGKKIWQNWVVGSITCEESIDQAFEKGRDQHTIDKNDTFVVNQVQELSERIFNAGKEEGRKEAFKEMEDDTWMIKLDEADAIREEERARLKAEVEKIIMKHYKEFSNREIDGFGCLNRILTDTTEVFK